MERVVGLEKRVRPFALVGLAFIVAWSALSLWSLTVSDVPAWFWRYKWIADVVTVVSLFAMLLAWIGAVRVVAYDPAITARARGRWIVILLATNLLGGTLLILARWFQDRRRENALRQGSQRLGAS